MNANTVSPREDFLASFCFVADGDVKQEIERLSELARTVQESLRYWEVLYVIPERCRAEALGSAQDLSGARNLRLIIVNDDSSHYRRRAIGASEAIGDVVVIGALQELGLVDLTALAIRAYRTNKVVQARRASGRKSLGLMHALLGAISPYRINADDMQTIALPRTKLNALLERSTLTLDLRYEPKHGAERYLRERVSAPGFKARRSIRDRYMLLEEIISTSTPSVLKAFAALSVCVAFLSVLYALYAVAMLLLNPSLQAGWFSTAIVQSGSVGFIAMGFTLLGIGVANIAERLTRGSQNWILEEVSNTDLFEHAKDNNVEMGSRSIPREESDG